VKAALLYEPRTPLVVETVSLSDPAPDEIRLRVVASGLCHSDLSVIDGKLNWHYPCLLGHEVAGVVEAVGSNVSRIKVGDHVVTCPSGFCGACEDCLGGHPSICATPGTRRPRKAPPRLWLGDGPDGTRVHAFNEIGGFASDMIVHERVCAVVHPDMPLDRAALIGCAVTTGFGAVIHAAKVQFGENVAVLGCGGIGLSAINAAAISGAGRIFAIDRVPEKLAMARVMGATDLIDASTTDPVQAIVELTGGGVHHAIEAIGLKTTIEQSFNMLRRGGMATIVGIPPLGTKIELDPFQFTIEKRIQGALMGSNRFPVDIPRFVDLYMQGRLKLDELISRRIGLEQINEAFDDMREGRTVARSVIEFA
jgi:S-(hydroxymethyl)glutathione dehydrogenase / alcohol dehydrogenase